MRVDDPFFTQKTCDRCGKPLMPARIMSWFMKQTICMDCSAHERELRDQLPDHGKDYEGCGYIPEVGETAMGEKTGVVVDTFDLIPFKLEVPAERRILIRRKV